MVDCGGDLRVEGPDALVDPFRVVVRHPLTGAAAHELLVAEGGVATSGIDRNLWRTPSGGYAHHLLDPASGRPAWTGLIGVTALAPTALEAETLAKAALLSGPDAGRRILGGGGGVLFGDDGGVEVVTAARGPRRVRLRRSLDALPAVP